MATVTTFAATLGRREPLRGLGLLFSFESPPYNETPVGAVELFRSGADGVHWSGMPAGSASGYVVVMTLPGSITPNLVVGESVQEFLSLGCVAGYWSLDMLVEDPAASLPPADEDYEADLVELRQALDLQPWVDVPGRLMELERLHGRPPSRVPIDRDEYDRVVEQSQVILREMKASFNFSGHRPE